MFAHSLRVLSPSPALSLSLSRPAFGVFLCNLYAQRSPIDEEGCRGLTEEIDLSAFEDEPLIDATLADLIERCLAVNPAERPTMEEVACDYYFDATLPFSGMEAAPPAAASSGGGGGGAAAAPAGVMSVMVPAGVQGGGTFQVQIPGRGTMVLTAPAGLGPGQSFQFQLPPAAAAPSGGLMQVTVPAGVSAGQMIQIQVPGKGLMQVAVPAGLGPGSTFQIKT